MQTSADCLAHGALAAAAPATDPTDLLPADALQSAMDYLDGPAEVLSASVACSRWRDLATADGLWRDKFLREGMRGKRGGSKRPAMAAAATAPLRFLSTRSSDSMLCFVTDPPRP